MKHTLRHSVCEEFPVGEVRMRLQGALGDHDNVKAQRYGLWAMESTALFSSQSCKVERAYFRLNAIIVKTNMNRGQLGQVPRA